MRRSGHDNLSFVDSSHGRPVVLVVDDSRAIRTVIEACLSGINCDIRFAANGPTALEMIDADPPDLVLLDVQMPGMDGYEVCVRIRANPRFKLLPVVMITARTHTQDRVRALEKGADDFMTKPFERAELVARVRSSLRLKSLYNTLDSAEHHLQLSVKDDGAFRCDSNLGLRNQYSQWIHIKTGSGVPAQLRLQQYRTTATERIQDRCPRSEVCDI